MEHHAQSIRILSDSLIIHHFHYQAHRDGRRRLRNVSLRATPRALRGCSLQRALLVRLAATRLVTLGVTPRERLAANYTFTWCSLSALAITETELKLMA